MRVVTGPVVTTSLSVRTCVRSTPFCENDSVITPGAAGSVQVSPNVIKSRVQVMLKVTVGSSVLVSRFNAILCVLSPVKSASGIGPMIKVKVSVGSGKAARFTLMNSKETLVLLLVLPELVLDTETWKVELGSVDPLALANAPFWVNF